MLGSNVFVSLPTGSGRSLCYCVLPNVFDFLPKRDSLNGSIVVVVSPLIALMQDQMQSMTERGVKAVYTQEALTTRWRPIRVQGYTSWCASAPSRFSLIAAGGICCRVLFMLKDW